MQGILVVVFFPAEVAVMGRCQTECLWGASLLHHLQLNLQQYCLLHVGGWKENLLVILHEILDGPHLACSISDVNLPSNTGFGAACEKED